MCIRPRIGAVLRYRLAAFVFTAVAVPAAVGGVCPCTDQLACGGLWGATARLDFFL